ncbi:hypothetical protein GJ496_009281 [Pomphorhynchus laevis]|nr:hypothetical protein GJ496_009281 [Pomphorhynchus laevis]
MEGNGVDMREPSRESDVLSAVVNIKATLQDIGLPENLCSFIEDQIHSNRISLEDFTDKLIKLINDLRSNEYRFECVEEFAEADLSRVVNKSALLYNILHRKLKETANDLKQDTSACTANLDFESEINKIIEETGYSYETKSSFRRYGPPLGEEHVYQECPDVYVGRIPTHLNETSIIPVFSKIGKIRDLRFMLNPNNGKSRGYCFIQYCNKEDAIRAVQQLDGYEILKDNLISVCFSRANTKLFIGNIPKYKTAEDIKQQLSRLVDGLLNVVIYPPGDPSDTRKNRGYCFAYFDTQRSASVAKKKLVSPNISLYGRLITVEWAEQRSDDDDSLFFGRSKTLHVKGIDEKNVDEDEIKHAFLPYGEVVNVKIIHDYAFVTFPTHNAASNALEAMNNQKIANRTVHVEFARPYSTKHKDRRRYSDQYNDSSCYYRRIDSLMRRYRSRSPPLVVHRRYHSSRYRRRSPSHYNRKSSPVHDSSCHRNHPKLKSTIRCRTLSSATRTSNNHEDYDNRQISSSNHRQRKASYSYL